MVKRAVLRHLRDRVADVAEPRRVVGVDPQAAGGLRAALDEVPGDRRRREAVEIVAEVPAELVRRRADRQRRIGDAAGDDDARAELQRLDDRLRAEVGVGADDLVADGRERFAGVEVVERVPGREQFVEPRQQVVAGDDADSRFAEPGLREDLARLRGARPAGSCRRRW